MRTKPLLGLLILGFAAVIIIPAITSGQYQFQPGGKKGQKGGGGGMMMDPNTIFDYYAKGQPFVVISDIRKNQDLAVQFAKEKGITNGKLTRAQFLEFRDHINTKLFAAPGGGRGPGGGKKFDRGNGNQPRDAANPAPAPNPDFLNSLADADFKRLDANSDGKLNMDEMPDRLKKNLDKWDKNKDGLIELLEYRDYYREAFAARFGGGGGGGDQATRNIASIIIDEDELDRKTVVFRAGPGGKMPAGLPTWFEKLDENGDGQVALYEWRKAGKDLDEFKDWDLNDDGFITPEEAVKVQAAIGGKSGTVASAGSATSADKGKRPAFGSTDGKGRFPFDMSKMKGMGKWGKKKDQ